LEYPLPVGSDVALPRVGAPPELTAFFNISFSIVSRYIEPLRFTYIVFLEEV